MDTERSRAPDPAEIRQCLFVRALEETDGAGERWTMAERVAASKASLAETGLDFVRSRTAWAGARIKGPLAAGFAGLTHPRQGLPGWAGPSAAGLAFLTGWLTHDLGPEGRVSLLAFPLLGLILWNLAVAVASLISFKRKPVGAPTAWPAWLLPKPPLTGDVLTDTVVARTEQEWQAAESRRWAARVKVWFHVAALLLAAGVVAGMYARGLVKNYQATWESTFLSQPGVSKLTRVVLGPASMLTGVEVPTVPSEGGLSPAAPWIHLWAASAGLFILCPRLLLISMARRDMARATSRWEQNFAGYEANARRLAAGQPLVARVLPVQCEPDSPLRDSLRGVLQHLWGGQVMVDFLPGVPYGGEDDCLESLTEPPTHLVLLLPLAVTPEDEVQGALHRGLREWLAGAVQPPFGLIVLDATSFEARTAGLPEAARRLAERRAAWEKILGPAWPLLVLDAPARRNPAAAAAAVAAARQPLRPWTPGS